MERADLAGGCAGTPTHTHHRAPDADPDRSAAVVVPVVLPQAVATVDDSGHARIVLDNLDHRDDIDCPAGPVDLEELGAALTRIAEQIGGPVRVEVREPDGSRYADILQPRTREPQAGEEQPQEEGEPDEGLTRGEGFLPGETVLVAVVATSTRADQDGAVSLTGAPTPPRRGGEVVLLGSASGTIVRGSLPARPSRSVRRWWR